MKEPKFFIKIQKAYQDNGNWFVQGVASGTAIDRDEEKMSKGVLEKFARSMPLPLTDNHPQDGGVLGELGKVINAEVLDDDMNSLFVKAQLDMDHPAVPYMVKQIQKGKKYAFSVEGLKPMTQQVWSESLKKMITEYVDVVPKAISITTEPSYTPSFMEVVAKSIKYNLSKNTTMEDKDVKTETKEVEVEEVKTETPVVEVESKEEVKADVAETPKVEEAETKEEVKTETQTEQPDVVVDKSAKKEKSVKKYADPVAVAEAVQETVEDANEDEAEAEEDAREYAMLSDLCMKVDSLIETVARLVESDKEVHTMVDDTMKSYKSTENVLKSFHDDIENLKELPLQKRSRVISKNFEERKEEDVKPKTVKDVVSNFI